MNKIRMKITGYEPETHSLLVAFASDTTSSADPATYPSYAFQPGAQWPGATIEEIKQNMAASGVSLARNQAAKEALQNNATEQQALLALVGQEFEYNITDVLPNTDPDSNTQVVL
jgi:hypothetical protein